MEVTSSGEKSGIGKERAKVEKLNPGFENCKEDPVPLTF